MQQELDAVVPRFVEEVIGRAKSRNHALLL